MNDCIVDIHEPEDAVPLLGQSIEAISEAINSQGYADYLWGGVDGKEQLERKTWDEVLGGMDAVEDQLRREVQAHPEVRTSLVIEGVATQEMQGSLVWVVSKGQRRVFHPKHNHRDSMSKAFAWIRAVQEYMPVYQTATFKETMLLVAALVKYSQREDHTTFRRHFRDMDWHPNPMVKGLMGLAKSAQASIGAQRAEVLIRRFGTIWNVINQKPQTIATVEGIGLGVAKKLLRGIGRTDV